MTSAEDDPTALRKYGEFLYDHVVHFASKSNGTKRALSVSQAHTLISFVTIV